MQRLDSKVLGGCIILILAAAAVPCRIFDVRSPHVIVVVVVAVVVVIAIVVFVVIVIIVLFVVVVVVIIGIII